MNQLREQAGLFIILAAFLALGTIYLRVTPLLETPDEPSHFSLVKFIADAGRLPPLQPPLPDAGPVPLVPQGPPTYYAPPLYYALSALLILDLDTDGFSEAVIPNPNWARGWAPTPGRTTENKNVYVHSAAQRPPYANWSIAMIRLRVFSLLLGGATVLATYALARALFGDKSWALAATALVAFNPAFLFVTVGVTNDALLFALSNWGFALMAWLVRLGRRLSPNNLALTTLLGITLGLTALTKQTGLIFLPAAALAVWWGTNGERRMTFYVLHFTYCLSLVALIAGWWYLRNALLYDDLLGFESHQAVKGVWQLSAPLVLRQLGQALRGYWGVFGWGLIEVEPAIYFLLAAFALGGMAGLASQRGKGKIQMPHTQRRIKAILSFGVLLNLIGLILWLLKTSAPYGRLLFPTLGPVAALLTLGWRRWLGKKSGQVFAWGVSLAFGLYAAVVPFRYLRPTYAHPVASPSTVETAAPLDVQFDGGLHLLGQHLASQRVHPGERARLTLYWQATASLERDLTVFVQLAPHDPEKRVAGLDTYLGSTRYPTSVWQPGEIIEQTYDLQLPQDITAPELYWFNVGLYDQVGGERLPGRADGASLPGGALWLGPLWVVDDNGPQPEHATDYRLGETIRLAGYDLALGPTNTLTVTLHWHALAAPGEDWTVFLHLLDTAGQPVAQDDRPPRQGDYPTWAWQAGDRVPDRHVLRLPGALPPGLYHLQAGLYHPVDGTRLPVFDSAHQRIPNDAMPLTEINLPGD